MIYDQRTIAMYARLDRLQSQFDTQFDAADVGACIDNLMEQEKLLVALVPTSVMH